MKYGLTEVPLWIEFMTEDRDELFDYLKGRGINCRKAWEPLIGFDNSKFYSDNVLWLPSGPTLQQYEIESVIEKIKDYYDEKTNNQSSS